jgi:NAD-dependent DNA ligase
MLVHSCIYYELNDNIVSDHQWQQWADELELLQSQNPNCVDIGFFDKEFVGWTGATGNHLPHRHPWVLSKSTYLLELSQNGH